MLKSLMGKAKRRKSKSEKRELLDKKPNSIASASGSLYFSIFIIIILVAFLFATYSRNTVWMDDLRLWKDAAKKSSEKARGHDNLGVAYYEIGQIDEAALEYITTLKLKPDLAEAHNNLGKIYYIRGQLDAAIQEYEIALRLSPNLAGAHSNLGLAYYDQGRVDEAMQKFLTALKFKPATISFILSP